MQEQQFSIKLKDKQIKFHYIDNAIKINIEGQQDIQKYKGHYQYQSLSIQFKVIFENLKEFYTFLTNQTQKRIKIQNQSLYILVYIVGKIKVFNLPLQKLQLSPQQQLKRLNKILNSKIQTKQLQINVLKEQLNNMKNLIDDKQRQYQQLAKENAELSLTLQLKQSQNLKLLNKIRLLENNLQEIHSERLQRCKSNHQKMNQTCITQDGSPVKKIQATNLPKSIKSKKQKQLQQFGKRLIFKIDDNSKYKNKFLINGNDIQKMHGPTYQLYHHQALPKEGRFYFDIKIILIKNNNIVVGVITDKNKDEQFSFKKLNSVCYNGYDGSICQQDKQRYVNIKPKQGNKLRTVIDMSLMQIQWYMIGGQTPKIHIGRSSIPFNMSKQTLYPYFQLYWQGNKIKLNP